MDQDFSQGLGDEEAYGHYKFRISCHTEPSSLYRNVKAFLRCFQYHWVKWNLVRVKRLHSPEARGAGNILPLEVPKDRAGYNTREKHVVLMP